MSTTTPMDHDRIDAMFDEYRPTASDADRQEVVDRIVRELRMHIETEAGEGLTRTDHDLDFEDALAQLEATPVDDPDSDQLLQDVRSRFRAHHGPDEA